jgi:hypothetical protein
MNDPFYNLYHIIVDNCKNNKFNINFEFFAKLGENNPLVLEDPNYKFSNLEEKIDQLLRRKIIFHDQEPILFNAFKKDWETKITTMNRVQTNHILSNSEQNSIEKDLLLARSHWHDFYWFSNGFLSLEWYRYYRYATYLENNWSPTKTFSSYNRLLTNREHRHIISSHLYNNFKEKIVLSYHSDNGENNLFINTSNLKSENLSYTIHTQDFVDSFCHVVTERIFYEDRIHLTEKVFRPIICCRPFILVSSPHSLSYLKKYGFKTFSDFWNEDYDSILDHSQRLDAILKIINQLGSLSQFEILNMLEKMKNILLFNRKHFYNLFQKLITKELFDNLNSVLTKKNNTPPFFLQLINSLNDKEIDYISNLEEMDLNFNLEDDKFEEDYLFKILNNSLQRNTDNYIRSDIIKHSKILRYQYQCTKRLDQFK